MPSLNVTRIWKRIGLLVASLVIAYGALIGWALWDSRGRHVVLNAAPMALQDDSTARDLATSAIRKLGYEPADYREDYCRRHMDSEQVVILLGLQHRSGTAPERPGLSLSLDQRGTEVVCTVWRAK
jgi:hypothetical protein